MPEPALIGDEDLVAAAPPDCQHQEWTFGCPRCWYEVSALAADKIQASTFEAQMEGAILFNWYVMLVLQDLERQLQPMTRDLDLSKVGLAKDLIANMKQIGLHLVAVVANPDKLVKAMAQAAALARAMASEEGKAELRAQVQAKRSSIVLTDGLG